MGELVIRNGLKLEGALPSGTGDSVLTVDGTTSAVGSIGAIDTSVFVSKTLPSANIYVGNGSNVATAVAVSGDVTIDNAGAVAIASGVIVNADINAVAAIAFSKMAALTASRALVTDGSGLVTVSAVTSTELGYLSGVTSALQTQLNAKQATITGGATSITSANLTASRALVSDGSGKVGVATTTATEIGYVNGVTSAIQTQLDGKQPDIQFKDEGVNAGTSGGVTAIDFVGAGVSAVESAGTLTVTIAGTANGLPSGGTAGQYLRKSSGTDYDAAWDTFTISDVTDITATAAEINALAGAGVSAAEMAFLANVTGDIQAQLDAKLSQSLTTGYIWTGVAGIATQLAPGSVGQVLTISGGVPVWSTPGVGGTVTSVAGSGGTTGMSFTGSPVTTSGTLTLTGTLVAANGGTGQSSYTVGDVLYASGATALSKLAGVATGNALISGGVSTAPSWGKIGLTTHISGTLAEGNGGTNQTTYTTGDILYASAANTLSKLAASTSGYVLTSNGAGAAPSWQALANTATTLNIGLATSAGVDRYIYAAGSSATIGLYLWSKGDGLLSLNTDNTGTGNVVIYGHNIAIGGDTRSTTPGDIDIIGNDSSLSGAQGSHIFIRSGHGLVGNANSGNIYAYIGDKAGSGIRGNIALLSNDVDFDDAELVIRVSQAVTAPSGALVADHFYFYGSDIVAGNTAPHFMTENGDIIKLYSISGWGTPTNTLTRTTFDTSTVTLQQLAERVGALISDLKTGHGLLKA